MAKRDEHRPEMSSERFNTILEAYGSCPEAWPSQERESVLAYMEGNLEARRIVQREAELDALLGEARSLEPSVGLRMRILEKIPTPQLTWWERVDGWASGLWPFGKSWQPVGVLVAAGALGLGIGLLGQGQELSSPSQAASADVAELALGDTSGFGELP